MNDLVRLACETAARNYGGSDWVFTNANFSVAFGSIIGVNTPIDGKVVRGILAGRSDVRVHGPSHFQLLWPKDMDAPLTSTTDNPQKEVSDGEVREGTTATVYTVVPLGQYLCDMDLNEGYWVQVGQAQEHLEHEEEGVLVKVVVTVLEVKEDLTEDEEG